jgi:hypothetical protein
MCSAHFLAAVSTIDVDGADAFQMWLMRIAKKRDG